jgi:hypothetical protein
MTEHRDSSGSASGRASARATKVFINYRREDTQGEAGRLSDRLKAHFGDDAVYLDVEGRAGVDWLKEIQSRGAEAAVVLCLIGKDWLESLRARSAPVMRGRPDYTRQEIEWALSDWSGRIFPVLIDAAMPDRYQVPRSLRGIWTKQAIPVRSDSFDRDVAELIRQIAEDVPSTAATVPAAETAAPRPVLPRRAKPALTVSTPSEGHYDEVINEMLEGWVVVFLGPNVRGSLPDSAYLAASLANEYGFSQVSPDLAEVAQRVLLIEGEDKLYGSIKRILGAASKPIAVHDFLAAFPRLLRQRGLPPAPLLIISTNYDWALEHAFETTNEPFDYAVYMAGSGRFVHYPWGDRDGEPQAITIDTPREYNGFPISEDVERTVLIKVHGSVDGEDPLFASGNSYLLTEDDYLRYLHAQEINDLLPVQILERIRRRKCLFLGYPLKDWNARLLLRSIWRETTLRNRSWAIEHDPEELELLTWRTIGNVDLLSADISKYVAQLRSTLLARLADAELERLGLAQ